MMKEKENEYREIFLAEALGNIEEVNRLLTILEKAGNESDTINALFRITHTLKGNASGMGFTAIAEMAHVLEDLFGMMREGTFSFQSDLFGTIYKGVDVLSKLIDAIRDGSGVVKYKGIKTKIEVLINRARTPSTTQAQPDDVKADEHNDLTPGIVDEEEDEESDARVTFSDLVQVPVRKLDNLLNLVGELIIEKDRIVTSRTGIMASNEYSRLSRISSDLQYSVMDVRLVQVGFLFNKFHRVVRDAASTENKIVKLKLEGTDTEIDRNILQVISDSLIHLIRNAVGHGIEHPEERQRAGKSKEGTIILSARNESDAVVIEIMDDGNGLNTEKIKIKAIENGLLKKEDADKLSSDDIHLLIFEPGFSTADQVTAISGRGVGMDVVKQTLDSIGGNIQVHSEQGTGTRIALTLPSSMTVKSCLLFNLDSEVYAIPLSYTESVVSLYKKDLHKVGGGLLANFQNRNIPVVFLKDLFAVDNTNSLQLSFDSLHAEQKLEIVVITFNGRMAGLVVDKLLQQKEIVEKPLMKPVDKIKFVSGVTILGSGNVCLVLNLATILQNIFSAHHGVQKNLKSVSLK